MKKYLLTACLAAFGIAADWPQFRGPDGGGVAGDAKPLPEKWSPTENVVWKSKIPGRGVSSPIVVGDRIYITSSDGFKQEKLYTLCYELATGKLLWERELTSTGNTGCHPKSCMAANTPVADSSGVYVLFATGDLAAFEKDGAMRWYRSLVADYPLLGNQVGMAASPILAGNTLAVPMDNPGDSFLLGVDPRYGNNLWKTPRPKAENWTSPIALPAKDGSRILMTSRSDISAYDSATGKQAWTLPAPGGSIPSAVRIPGKLLVPAGAVVALDIEGDKPKEAWKSQVLASGSPTPVFFDGRIYNVSGANVLVCADAKTGKEIWKERLEGKAKFWASPIIGDGKVFVFNEEGLATVAKLGGDKAEILSRNDLKEEILGTPAIADGKLIIRTDKGLWCFGVK